MNSKWCTELIFRFTSLHWIKGIISNDIKAFPKWIDLYSLIFLTSYNFTRSNPLIAIPYSSLSPVLLLSTSQSVTESKSFVSIVFSMSRLALFMSRKLFWGQKIEKVNFWLIKLITYACLIRQNCCKVTRFV